MLIRKSNPDGFVLPIADVLSRLRAPSDDEKEITAMLCAATARYQQRTQRIMLPTEFEWRAPTFDCIGVPVVPLRDVTSLTYVYQDGEEQTVGTDVYRVDLLDDRGFRVHMNDGFGWPNDLPDPLPVRVWFEAGYDDPAASGSGDDPALAQNPIDLQAILMLTAHWYRSREIAADVEQWDVPAAFEDLVAERRIYR